MVVLWQGSIPNSKNVKKSTRGPWAQLATVVLRCVSEGRGLCVG